VALKDHLEHQGEGLRVWRVLCSPSCVEAGDVEVSRSWTLVLPLRGAFRKHSSRGNSFLADATGGAFFLPHRPYRASHLDLAGDECLSFNLEPPFLGFEQDAEEVNRCAHDPAGFPLPAAAQLLRARLGWRLRGGFACALEVEESASRLFAAAFSSWRAHAGRHAVLDREPASLRRRRADAVLERLHADCGRNWRLAELARAAHSSPRQLTASFREVTGLSIHGYLVSLRLARALEEVLHGERDLSAVGLDLGFSTPSHFAASFKAAYGVPPTALRSGRPPSRA
jgi:AraC-like DNA-binding protein